MSESMEATGGWAQLAARNAGRLILLGVVTAIAGLVALASPFAAGLGVAVLVGIALAIGGAARIVGVISAGSFGQGALALVGGILALVAGATIAARPGLGLATLTLMLGVYLLIDGVSGAVLSFHVRSEKGWGWMLLGSVLGGILGLMLIAEWPMSGQWAIGTLVGINLLSSGASMIVIGSASREVTKRAAYA